MKKYTDALFNPKYTKYTDYMISKHYIKSFVSSRYIHVECN